MNTDTTTTNVFTSITLRFVCSLLMLCSSVLSAPASAHVKWFVEFDIADPPQPVLQLLSPMMLGFILLAITGITVSRYVDAAWSKQWTISFLPFIKTEHTDLPLTIVRVGTGVFFMALWLIGNTILTPELTTDSPYIPAIQLTLAIATFFRSLFPLIGIGILGLYGYAVYRYGLFHMLDYVFFVALGLFFILTHLNIRRLNPHRINLFRWFVGFAFMWSAMEKIAYPQWFDPFLDQYPFLQMGFERDFFLLSAAFVELSLFYIIMRYHNGAALIALIANLMVFSGNLYFGKIDALGHFPANMMLLVITLVGNNKIQCPKQNLRTAALTETLRFVLTCMGILTLYYFLHWLEFGN